MTSQRGNKQHLLLFKDADVIFQLVILGSSIFFLIITWSYPKGTRDFPEVLLYSIIFLCLVYLVFRFFFPKYFLYLVTPESEEDEDEVVRARNLTKNRFYLGWVTIGISVSILILFGFIFLIPVYFTTYTLLLGHRKALVRVSLVGLIITGVVYMIFGYFLYLPMIGGLLISR